DALCGLPAIHRKRPHGIQLVQLAVQHVTAILSGEQRIRVRESQVVERGMVGIAEHEDGNPAAVAVFAKVDPEDRSPRSARCQLWSVAGIGIGVSCRTEEESAE